MEKKFTKRELYDALIGKLCGEEVEVDAQTLVDFCQAEIDRIDQRNAKDREKREAKKAEPDVAREKVFAVIDEQFRTAMQFMTLLMMKRLLWVRFVIVLQALSAMVW